MPATLPYSKWPVDGNSQQMQVQAGRGLWRTSHLCLRFYLPPRLWLRTCAACFPTNRSPSLLFWGCASASCPAPVTQSLHHPSSCVPTSHSAPGCAAPPHLWLRCSPSPVAALTCGAAPPHLWRCSPSPVAALLPLTCGCAAPPHLWLRCSPSPVAALPYPVVQPSLRGVPGQVGVAAGTGVPLAALRFILRRWLPQTCMVFPGCSSGLDEPIPWGSSWGRAWHTCTSYPFAHTLLLHPAATLCPHSAVAPSSHPLPTLCCCTQQPPIAHTLLLHPGVAHCPHSAVAPSSHPLPTLCCCTQQPPFAHTLLLHPGVAHCREGLSGLSCRCRTAQLSLQDMTQRVTYSA